MKLGVSYNLFDGEELLPYSIQGIRENVDFICVVYQNTSNFGEKRSDLECFLNDLIKKGLVDYIYCYKPREIKGNNTGQVNEIVKRNVGRDICVKVGKCTHHISLDCDEMFIPKDFKKAKEKTIKNDYDSTYIPYDNYYKKPYYIIEPKGVIGHISFIVKCDSRNYGQGLCPVTVDPTRVINSIDYNVFSPREIKMHHYSWLRASEKSLRRKLDNTSFKKYSDFTQDLEKIIYRYKNYKEGESCLKPWINGCIEEKVIKVKDKVKNSVEKIIW